MRRLIASALIFTFVFLPSTPIVAFARLDVELFDPLNKPQDSSDFVSLDQMQQSQDSSNQQLLQQAGVLSAMSLIAPATGIGFSQMPVYSAQIAKTADFTAQVRIDNTASSPKAGYLMIGFTPVATGAQTIETYHPFTAAVGGSTLNYTITNAQLAAAGVTPGRYTISFAAYNDQDQRVGQFFAGNPFSLGSATVTVPNAPVVPTQIGVNSTLTVDFSTLNTGDFADPITAVIGITPVGSTNPADTREFYSTLNSNVGTTSQRISLTALQLQSQGIGAGRYTVSVSVINSQDQLIRNFFGNPLVIGTVAPAFTAAPSYNHNINSNTDLVTSWTLGNSGTAPDQVTLVAAITPVGGTEADTKEFSKVVTLPAGGLNVDFTLTAAQLAAAGITAGEYLISFAMLDGQSNRVNAFYGNVLLIGTSNVAAPVSPIYSNSLNGTTDDFTAQWNFTNDGTVRGPVSLLTTFTRIGSPTSVELYKDSEVLPGGGSVNILYTPAQLAAAGITAGDYTISFIAFDANGNRIAQFFGNPLSIGASATDMTAIPAYATTITPSDPFVSSWTLTNTAVTTGVVTLAVSFTQVGSSTSVEFDTNVSVAPGGGTFQVNLTQAQLAARGIGAGRYTVSFVAVDAANVRIGEFYGNPLTIGSSVLTVPALAAVPTQIGRNDPFTVGYQVTNTGDFADPLTTLLVFTPVGALNPDTAGIELYSPAIAIAPGTQPGQISYTAAQLRALGIDPGRWLVTTAFYNGAGDRVAVFYGNLVTIGVINTGLPVIPAIPSNIDINGDLNVDFVFTNTGDTADKAVALLVFTPPGATDPAQSKEFYFPRLAVNPGGSIVRVTLTAAELAAAGITPGDWLITATAFDGADNRLQSYFGNLVTVGTSAPAFGTLPAFSGQILPGADLNSSWTLGNTGNAPSSLTLVIGITPVGATDPAATKEFTQFVSVPAGGAAVNFSLSAAQLAAAGISTGEYLVSFTALNAAGTRVNSFFGNLLLIGSSNVIAPAAPIYSAVLNGTTEDFTAQWTFTNDGTVRGAVSVLTTFTRAGTTNTIELYKDGEVLSGGGTVNILYTPAQLAAAGITAGEYTLSFVAFDANGNRIGQFFGNPLAIGSSAVTIAGAPSYNNAIAVNTDFVSNWTLGNTGAVSGNVTLAISFTHAGTTNTVEFDKTGVVAVGGSTVTVTLTAAELAAAGITAGNYTVSFVAVNAAGTRIGEFFGNPLSIGTIAASFATAPAYPANILPGADFTTNWTLGNTGNAPDRVSLIVAITPVGATDPSQTKEFTQSIDLIAGGINFDFTITAAQLAAAGIGAGEYLVNFQALNSSSQTIGSGFPGNLLLIGSSNVAAPAAPIYSAVLNGTTEDFTAQWTFTNNGTVRGSVSLLTVFSRAGGTTSIELYKDGEVLSGGGTVNILYTPAQLAAAGITAGEYTLSFVAFDANGNRIGQFFGNPLAIGSSAVSIAAAPSYNNAIAVNTDFVSSWTLGNTGAVSGNVTLAISFTHAGTTNTVEFDKTGSVDVGGETIVITLTAAELAAAGITAGNYTVSFVAVDAANNRIGEFFGNPLTIGTIAASFATAPVYPANILPGADFTSNWTLGNTGNAPDRVSLIVAITPVGATDPAQTKEFTQVVDLPAGGATVDFTLTAAQLAASGIGAGEYLVNFQALNSSSQTIGSGFSGNLLLIGSSNVTAPAAPIYSAVLNGTTEDFTAQWTLGNNGTVRGTVSLLTVFSRAGGATSIELYKDGVVLSGGGTVNILYTPAQLAAAGITAGEYTLSFVAFDANGNRIGQFFGNPLAIGSSAVSIAAAPSYNNAIGVNADFTSNWTLGNTGTVSGNVTLAISLTRIGTTTTVEFDKAGVVAVGGSNIAVTLTAAELAAAGITAGSYTVSFVAVNAAGTHIGEFFGNPLSIGTATASFTTLPGFSSQVATGGNFEASFSIVNSGNAPAAVTLVAAFTPAAGGTTIELSRQVSVAVGGASFDLTFTPAELIAAGIPGGRYRVSFAAVDQASATRLNIFAGNAVTLGTITPSFPSQPSFNNIPANSDLTANWTIGNTGDTADSVTLVTVITPVGATDPALSKQFTQTAVLPAGGQSYAVTVTAAQLAAAGIVPGEYLISFQALNGFGDLIGTGFFGVPLSIGTAVPAAASAPIYSSAITSADDFTAQWTLTNTGPVNGTVTLLTVFTPIGSSNSIEIYRTASVAPGGGTANILLTHAQLGAAGIGEGEYNVSFVAFDENDNRIGQFFGNPFAYGTGIPAFSAAPSYSAQIAEGQSLMSQWTLANSGPVSSVVTLVISITSGGTTVEFDQNSSIRPGGQTVNFSVSAADLAAHNILTGNYTVSFAAIGNTTRLNLFTGQPLEVIAAQTPTGFLLTQQLESGPFAGLAQSWLVMPGDALESQLSDRGFVYDEAISAIALSINGTPAKALETLLALERLEAGTGKLGFVYATGSLGNDFLSVYTGTNAWVLDALVTYEFSTGDTQFRPMINRIWANLQSYRDAATGLFRGGEDADGNLFPWISTEHNLDLYFFLDDYAALTNDSAVAAQRDALGDAIDAHLYDGDHFLQGFGDDLVVLDTQALGGIFLAWRGDTSGRLQDVRNSIENRLKKTVTVNGNPVDGYAPYQSDNFIWTEGSYMVAVLDFLMGDFESMAHILDSMENFRDASGGVNYSSSTSVTNTPGSGAQFPAYPHLGATAWGVLAQAYANLLVVGVDTSSGGDISTLSAALDSSPEAVVTTAALTSTPVISPFSPVLPGPSTTTSRISNFRLTGGDYSLLNMLPGFYTVNYLAYQNLRDLISDGFFGSLARFLFGY